MFLRFPHEVFDFSEEEWDDVSRTDKCVIRDFFLNDRDVEQTMLFGYYETDRKIRRAVNIYDLRNRPRIQISIGQQLGICFSPAT